MINNHPYWQENIPCLHRLHDAVPTKGAHRIQHDIGMSLSLNDLQNKLMQLNQKLQQHNNATGLQQKALVTFDDGYRDNLLSLPILQNFPNLQPVLFLTGKQLRGDITPLPLCALYHYCDAKQIDPDDMQAQYGFDRQALKRIPEDAQQTYLQTLDIDLYDARDDMLNVDDVALLINHGWLLGYHGYEHYDLTLCDAGILHEKLTQDMALLQDKGKGYMPWFAYPEGRYNQQMADMAREVGFTLQFSLAKQSITADDILADIWAREIWR